MSQLRPRVIGDERGIILATFIVFMVVLSLVVFSAALLTRTDIQIVNNNQTSKQALYVAEAGTTEALIRLGLTSPSNVTVNGRTFDAAIMPYLGDKNWNGVILLGSFAPSTSGSTFTTPTIQSMTDPLLYSTTAFDSNLSLTLKWELDGSGNIKTINSRPVLQIISVGESGTARRKVTREVTADIPTSVVLDPTGCGAVQVGGNVIVTLSGGVQVNSSCATALTVQGNAALRAGGPINIYGNYSTGGGGIVSPNPSTGISPLPDPLASLPAPTISPSDTQHGTAGSADTYHISGVATLSPGVYYGGLDIRSGAAVTLLPGTYVMAGGGFSVGSNASVTGPGVTIYSTNNVGHSGTASAYGEISLSSTTTMNLTAPVSGTYKGIMLFQDRALANTQPISLGGGFAGTLNGSMYAANGLITASGNTTGIIETQLIAKDLRFNGNTVLVTPSTPVFTGNGYQPISWQDY